MPNVMNWLRSNTNAPLCTTEDVDFAVSIASTCSWPLHPDRWKNWDSVLAALHAANTTKFNEPVLDAGACRDSAFLPSLRRLGYTDLTGINLLEPHQATTELVDNISYHFGDITDTGYPDEHFGFIACLSVIEHEVDWEKFIQEMARVIRHGGRLFVSMDYWDTHHYTRNARVGPPPSSLQLFSAKEVEELVTYAMKYDLYVDNPVHYACAQKVVHSGNQDFTFFNLLFEKVLGGDC